MELVVDTLHFSIVKTNMTKNLRKKNVIVDLKVGA